MKADTIVLARHNYAGGEAMKQMQKNRKWVWLIMSSRVD
jgi:hypothetical protein